MRIQQKIHVRLPNVAWCNLRILSVADGFVGLLRLVSVALRLIFLCCDEQDVFRGALQVQRAPARPSGADCTAICVLLMQMTNCTVMEFLVWHQLGGDI